MRGRLRASSAYSRREWTHTATDPSISPHPSLPVRTNPSPGFAADERAIGHGVRAVAGLVTHRLGVRPARAALGREAGTQHVHMDSGARCCFARVYASEQGLELSALGGGEAGDDLGVEARDVGFEAGA